MHSRTSRILGSAALLLALAVPYGAAPRAQDHPGQYSQADIDAGARVYSTQCSSCHGPNGDQVSGIDLRRGQFRQARSDEDLQRIITSGTSAGMPPFALQPAEMTGILAFIRAGFDPAVRPIRIGHAARGEAIVQGKGACLTCHRINANGSRLAPDLTDVGAARTAEALHRSLVDPSAGMMPINRPVRAVTREGRTITGRRLNEDTFTVQLIDDKEQLHSLVKADLRSLVVETQSTMPSYASRLTPEELADVIAYLLTLKGN